MRDFLFRFFLRVSSIALVNSGVLRPFFRRSFLCTLSQPIFTCAHMYGFFRAVFHSCFFCELFCRIFMVCFFVGAFSAIFFRCFLFALFSKGFSVRSFAGFPSRERFRKRIFHGLFDGSFFHTLFRRCSSACPFAGLLLRAPSRRHLT